MFGMAYGLTTSGNNLEKKSLSRPRLIFLTQYYDPEPAYKGQVFAEALCDLGYDVEVVTGFPNYPDGKTYEGYCIRLLQRSESNGIKITRLPLFPSHSGSKVGRIANYVTFMLSAFLYLSFFAKNSSLIYVYNPPLTVGLAATASRIFRRRTPVIVDVHDLWPDTLAATGMLSNPSVLAIIGRVADWMYSRVQFIILHTHGFRSKLLERGVVEECMETVIGWTNEYPQTESRQDVAEGLAGLPGLKLLYAGNIGPAQALDAVVEAAAILQRDGNGELASFCFMGAGVSRDGLLRRTKELELSNVFFLPHVTPDEVGVYLHAADALLVHLRADPLFAITLPSKTQAYMYSGKPLIMACHGEASRLIESARAGVIAMPENPESIAEAVTNLALLPEFERYAMGERAREYYMRELSMDKGMDRFDKIFKSVLNKFNMA